ncbi:MAG: prolyl-tRNA synthetase associated domain-containing protein [Pseudomonadota bacterium]
MPATRADLFQRLAELGIETETHEHRAVFTVEQSRELHARIPGGHSKNLFLKDAKDRLWLIVAPAEAAVDLKALPERIGSKRLSFGRPELLFEALGVEAGSVTPFALINDTGRRMTLVIDQAMLSEEVLNFHPLENTATTSISPADLIAFVRACGHEPVVVALGCGPAKSLR